MTFASPVHCERVDDGGEAFSTPALVHRPRRSCRARDDPRLGPSGDARADAAHTRPQRRGACERHREPRVVRARPPAAGRSHSRVGRAPSDVADAPRQAGDATDVPRPFVSRSARRQVRGGPMGSTRRGEVFPPRPRGLVAQPVSIDGGHRFWVSQIFLAFNLVLVLGALCGLQRWPSVAVRVSVGHGCS
jgi:hypothetical protein